MLILHYFVQQKGKILLANFIDSIFKFRKLIKILPDNNMNTLHGEENGLDIVDNNNNKLYLTNSPKKRTIINLLFEIPHIDTGELSPEPIQNFLST